MNILKSILKLKIYKIVAIIILGYGVLFFFGPPLNEMLIPNPSWEIELFFIMIFGLILLYLGKRLYSSKNSKIINKSLQEIPEILKELSRRYSLSTDLKNLKSNIDASSILLNTLCFLTPVFGLIIFLVQYDKYPIRTKAAVKSAKIGLLTMVIIGVISILSMVIMINMM
jgi:MFS family permease